MNKAQLVRKIAELREEKKEALAGIDYVADESDRTGMRVVIRVKKDTDVNALLKVLYKYTELEVTFGINMVVIADGKPREVLFESFDGEYVTGHTADFIEVKVRSDKAMHAEMGLVTLISHDSNICEGMLTEK